MAIPVIDIFAGPGGLSEGFSTLRDNLGNPVFKVALSIEKDEVAGKTLRLRAFMRQFKCNQYPNKYFSYISNPSISHMNSLAKEFEKEWSKANEEVWVHTLKEKDSAAIKKIRKALGGSDNWILIGGPPCQAYSLVGRARRKNETRKHFEKDKKHTLYKCYLNIVKELEPTAFIMENVKGLISARHKNDWVFEQIRRDFEDAGYNLYSFVKPDSPDMLAPQDYLICSEAYGIPQARHRVIFFGLKKGDFRNKLILKKRDQVSISDVIGNMPHLRSSFSRREKNEKYWGAFVRSCASHFSKAQEEPIISNHDLAEAFELLSKSVFPDKHEGKRLTEESVSLNDWFRGSMQGRKLITNHESRSHVSSDIRRYLYCSTYASVMGCAPKLTAFPISLLPAHKNVNEWKEEQDKELVFSDRFKVQIKDNPSSTVTSHIAKDGHYFIHYDPTQCRSLTVREAARLQTFPDDYFFEGNRTEQFHQVGNAVPPLLSQQIAAIVADYLGTRSNPYYPIATEQ